MFGLRLHRKKEEAPSKAKPRLNLGHHERIRLYALVTVVLLALALVSLALQIHPSGQKGCSGIVLSQPRDNCYLSMANYTDNATVCRSISSINSQAGCITSIALSKDNATICAGLANSTTYYYQCVTQISQKQQNPTDCVLLSEPYSSQCAYALATNQSFSDNSTCAYVSNSSQASLCNSMYYYNTAISKSNPGYCSQLPNYTDRLIVDSILQQNTGNYTLQLQQVQLAELNLTPRGYCYYRLASLTSNYSLCAGQPGVLGQLCSYGESSTNQTALPLNASVCSSAPSQIANVCTYAVLISTALTSENLSACSQISDINYKYACITAYASKYNSTACTQISNLTYRQSCYASATSNATVNSTP